MSQVTSRKGDWDWDWDWPFTGSSTLHYCHTVERDNLISDWISIITTTAAAATAAATATSATCHIVSF